MERIKFNYSNAMLRICVDEGHSGTIIGQRLREPILFHDFVDLVLKIESVLDGQDFPRAFQRKRQFQNSPPIPVTFARCEAEMMPEETVSAAFGTVATFTVQIIARQNTSWQGAIFSAEKTNRKAFQSDLEFLTLLDEMLSET